MGSRGDLENQIQKVTKEKLEDMKRKMAAMREQSLKNIISVVCDIKPELHTNYSSLAVVAAKN